MSALTRARELLDVRAVPAATRAAYDSDWRQFAAWCGDAGRDPLPSTDEVVSLYLVHCAEVSRLKVATIQRRAWAISWQHKRAGHPSPVGARVWVTLQAIARAYGSEQRRVKALSIADVTGMVASLDLTRAAGLRDRALLLLGFSTGLRCSSLCSLLVSDVEFVSRGLLVHLRREKQDQEGRGRTIAVLRGEGGVADVVAAVCDWLAVEPGRVRLFGVSSRWVRQVVKDGCVRVGLDAREYSSHSLRAGMITALDEAGVSLPNIMQRSGHKSPEVAARYVRVRESFSLDPFGQAGLGLVLRRANAAD